MTVPRKMHRRTRISKDCQENKHDFRYDAKRSRVRILHSNELNSREVLSFGKKKKEK